MRFTINSRSVFGVVAALVVLLVLFTKLQEWCGVVGVAVIASSSSRSIGNMNGCCLFNYFEQSTR